MLYSFSFSFSLNLFGKEWFARRHTVFVRFVKTFSFNIRIYSKWILLHCRVNSIEQTTQSQSGFDVAANNSSIFFSVPNQLLCKNFTNMTTTKQTNWFVPSRSFLRSLVHSEPRKNVQLNDSDTPKTQVQP